jgi:hypothetical protein
MGIFMFFLLTVVMATAAALPVVMRMVFLAAGTALMVMVDMALLPGTDLNPVFHSPGQLLQFRNERVGILRGQPELSGGKGDDSFLHRRMGVKFGFYLGSAVGAVQILYGIDLPFHRISS